MGIVINVQESFLAVLVILVYSSRYMIDSWFAIAWDHEE